MTVNPESSRPSGNPAKKENAMALDLSCLSTVDSAAIKATDMMEQKSSCRRIRLITLMNGNTNTMPAQTPQPTAVCKMVRISCHLVNKGREQTLIHAESCQFVESTV